MNFTILMTPEEHEKLTGLSVNASASERLLYWQNTVYAAHAEALAYYKSFDEGYWTYIMEARDTLGMQSVAVNVGCQSTTNSNNEYADQGYMKITFGYSFSYDNPTDEELQAREKVEELFSEGGDLYGYGRENDLKTDFEKFTAVFDWISSNITYNSKGGRAGYAALVENKTVCSGYTAASQLLLKRAGLDVRCLLGRGCNEMNF